jgi:hypothetical protein
MSDHEQTWPAQAFDAISIAGRTGQFTLEGIDGDQVRLESNSGPWFSQDLVPAGRWLQIYLWKFANPADITLRLPKNKAWVIELSAGRGNVEVNNLQTRLQVMLGKGDARIMDCTGNFDVMSGNGQVRMERCTEAEMPERPPLPQDESETESPAIGAELGSAAGTRSQKMKSKIPWDWWDWGEDDWTDWGLGIGEQATAWGMQFAQHAQNWAMQFSHGFGRMGWPSQKVGVNLQLGKGDVLMQDIQADGCNISLGRGDGMLDGGLIGGLNIMAGHGDVKCESVLPTGDWMIKTSHGSIDLALPADTRAQLDVATRHGDIRSDIPLVRVARPGPEARHGGRMVGTVGQVEGKSGGWLPNMRARVRIKAGNWVITDKDVKVGNHEEPENHRVPEIGLVASNGDIKIVLQGAKSRFVWNETTPGVTNVNEGNRSETDASPSKATQDEPSGSTNPTSGTSNDMPTGGRERVYDSNLAVLQALRAGEISVDEAEHLLRSMGS